MLHSCQPQPRATPALLSRKHQLRQLLRVALLRPCQPQPRATAAPLPSGHSQLQTSIKAVAPGCDAASLSAPASSNTRTTSKWPFLPQTSRQLLRVPLLRPCQLQPRATPAPLPSGHSYRKHQGSCSRFRCCVLVSPSLEQQPHHFQVAILSYKHQGSCSGLRCCVLVSSSLEQQPHHFQMAPFCSKNHRWTVSMCSCAVGFYCFRSKPVTSPTPLFSQARQCLPIGLLRCTKVQDYQLQIGSCLTGISGMSSCNSPISS